ncbi:hypothetical protein DDE82_009020 [Stemphylium lycopersici]|uniref:Protein kinase domain-containing protein n=1 Tax=Stemphylium lycopersici TaxID=183478 RepID=A0A364MRI7_STELY|nr:hypothetical protein TW65_07966 [Stemphylium lycopersici]RAQ98677.1 hypothetical protein DDE82_009020 [Stemphylium lycopersici]RAR00621.1 hypothetical protein DDE83_009078 [Stemphylium lycopersici]
MGLITSTRANLERDGYHYGQEDKCHEAFEDRFMPLDAAGMGFFGIVFYALTKFDFAVERSLLISDPVRYNSADGLRKVQAVKICNPLCPSGTKASAEYLMKEIKAMKRVWSEMEECVRHNFVRLCDYSTSNGPWYSMEHVTSGVTLETLYRTNQAKQSPVIEELAFHLVDQITKACVFLHEKCGIVCADVNRRNIMLRYPGRETPLMPDVVMIDWSLWEEANAERVDKDTKDVYESVFPVLFEVGWSCGMSHDQKTCTVSDAGHSREWLHLYKDMSARQLSLRHLGASVKNTSNESRRRVSEDCHKADKVQGSKFANESARA